MTIRYSIQPAMLDLAAPPLRVFDIRRGMFLEWIDSPRNPVTAYRYRVKAAGAAQSQWPYWWTYHLDTAYRFDDALVVRVVELLPPESENDLIARHPLNWIENRRGERFW